MRRNELRFATSSLGEHLVSLWALKPKPYHDYLIDGSYGDTKLGALWNLIKWMHRYGKLQELFYIRSIKYEQK